MSKLFWIFLLLIKFCDWYTFFVFPGSCIDEMAVNYPCPFCSDDYDLAELCEHIDEEHALDANNGVISWIFRYLFEVEVHTFRDLEPVQGL